MTLSPIKMIQLAQSALHIGRRDKAAVFYRLAIIFSPLVVSNYKELGALFVKEKNYFLAARIYLHAAISSDQSDVKHWFQYAAILEKAGEKNQAKKAYQLILKRWPEYLPAHIGMVTVASANDDQQGLARHLKKTLELPNLHPNVAIKIGTFLSEWSPKTVKDQFFDWERQGSLSQRVAGYRCLAFAKSVHKSIHEVPKHIKRVLVVQPNDTDINKLYAVLKLNDELHSRKTRCHRALCLQVDDPTLLNDLARWHLQDAELGIAFSYSQRCLELSQNFHTISVHVDILLKMGESSRLVALAEDCLVYSQDDNGLWNKIILALDEFQCTQETILFANKAVRKFSKNAINHFNLGLFLSRDECHEAAIRWFKQAALIQPTYAKAYNQLGLSIRFTSHSTSPERFCFWATYSDPNLATAWLNLGIFAVSAGRRRQGILFFQKAIDCQNGYYPDAYYNIALQLIALGDLQQGYDLYRWRWKTPQFPSKPRNYPHPEWPGPQKCKNENLIVYTEQGMGDEVMYSWIFPHIRTQVAQLTVECDERLTAIFSRTFEDINFVPRRTDMLPYADDPRIQYSASIGNTVCYFIDEIRHRIASMRANPIQNGHRSTPSLRTDPERRRYWRNYLYQEFGERLVVGVAWRSSKHDRVRDLQYMTPQEISQALGFDVGVVNLQYSHTQEEHIAFCKLGNERQFKFATPPDIDLKNDLDDLFALIEVVDVVISPLISVPWMAAAVGTPCFVTRYDEVGQIWQQLGTDFLPFGPGIKLFFKNSTQNWDSTLRQIRASLGALVAQK